MYKRGGFRMNDTQNLGLTIPNLNDEIHQTIVDLGNNFLAIDRNAELQQSHYPTTGHWNIGARIWNSAPSIGSSVGWINVRTGEAAPAWVNLTAYSVGDLIVPNQDNGHYYECIQSGRSGVNEPIFPLSAAGTIKDIHGSTTWQANKRYELNEIVIPTLENNRFYLCTVAGTSGGVEPNWTTTDGTSTDDHEVVWLSYRITVWQEKGVAAHFRPFGEIR